MSHSSHTTSRETELRLTAAAARRLSQLRLVECFDPSNLDSRPTPSQQVVLDDIGIVPFRYVRGGNQTGKTQLGGREASWVFTETHPKWKRPVEWGDERLLLIILGKTTKHLEETVWHKIKSFLPANSYKEHRSGGVLGKVTHTENGNTILFISHNNPGEAWKNLQGYVAHWVWVDEMPSTYKLISEAHKRRQARSGPFLMTFTPKSVNLEIQRHVDGIQAPHGKVYRLRTFDNPIYTDGMKAEILAGLAGASETWKLAELEGAWMVGEEMVYYFDYDAHVEAPEGYSPTWRHMEVVDPALKSKLGLTVYAENPHTNIWYMVRDDYVSGIYDPALLVEEVRKLTSQYNIFRRRSDPHEVWYITTASSRGITYEGVYKKNERKGELIKGLQTALGEGKLKVAPWCENFIGEIQSCRWSETADQKIVNASSYHLLDTAQYFTDSIPKPDPNAHAANTPWHQWLYEQNEKRKRLEETQKNRTGTRGAGRLRVLSGRLGGGRRWRK